MSINESKASARNSITFMCDMRSVPREWERTAHIKNRYIRADIEEKHGLQSVCSQIKYSLTQIVGESNLNLEVLHGAFSRL